MHWCMFACNAHLKHNPSSMQQCPGTHCMRNFAAALQQFHNTLQYSEGAQDRSKRLRYTPKLAADKSNPFPTQIKCYLPPAVVPDTAHEHSQIKSMSPGKATDVRYFCKRSPARCMQVDSLQQQNLMLEHIAKKLQRCHQTLHHNTNGLPAARRQPTTRQ